VSGLFGSSEVERSTVDSRQSKVEGWEAKREKRKTPKTPSCAEWAGREVPRCHPTKERASGVLEERNQGKTLSTAVMTQEIPVPSKYCASLLVHVRPVLCLDAP